MFQKTRLIHWFENAIRILRSPKMALAFTRWQSGRLFRGLQTRSIGHDVKVSGFRQFSEFWSFQPPTDAEKKLIERVAKNSRTLVDIGANIGAFTLLLGRCAPKARIYSFEPAPSTFPLLEANIRQNQLDNVVPLMRAVCDRGGSVEFTNAEHGSQNNSLIRASCLTSAPRVQVPAITLDQFCAEQQIDRIDFLKIDTEGAESMVLLGAAQTFRRKAVAIGLMEISAYWIRSAGKTAADIAAQIRSLGYELHKLNDDGTFGQKMTDEFLNRIELDNVLLLPNP